jgi:sirohydrochlorin cobaltochelatase
MTNPGVLLIGHGTRDAVGTAQFFALSELLGHQLAPIPVQPSLLELRSPTIAEGWQLLAHQGVTHIHAVPLLLFAAGHAKTDIPRALAECQQQTPEISWDQSKPLSRSRELLDLAVQRLDAVLVSQRLDLNVTAIVMVGRGSHDPCAQADLRLLAHCIGGRRRARHVKTAFYAMAEPKLPGVLDELARDRSIHNIIVQPHLLFEGAIHQAMRELVKQSQDSHPHCRHWCTGYLGPKPEVAAALARRIGFGKPLIPG